VALRITYHHRPFGAKSRLCEAEPFRSCISSLITVKHGLVSSFFRDKPTKGEQLPIRSIDSRPMGGHHITRTRAQYAAKSSEQKVSNKNGWSTESSSFWPCPDTNARAQHPNYASLMRTEEEEKARKKNASNASSAYTGIQIQSCLVTITRKEAPICLTDTRSPSAGRTPP
jgi:hypothetical protein